MPDAPVEYVLLNDPKHLVFTLARYKFVAKMFSGMKSVLEVGCGNGFATGIVKQEVANLHSTDEGELDITEQHRPGHDGVFCLDVIEHIDYEKQYAAFRNLSLCAPVCIIGTPSLESQRYASVLSKEKHIGCLSGNTLRMRCKEHWNHVFIFGMNDETLHTGFLPMSHYLFALCTK